ncbi:MAG TPA: response regulator [Abditibacteriaceae bacterium]|jgi:DNA-binding response OmpR family regulator
MLDVLLVEDDHDSAALVTRMLQSPPGRFRVYHVGTIKRACELLQGLTFSVMLLDLLLPDGDGRVLLAEAHRLVPRLPVIVTSTLDDENTVRGLFAAGADDFIGKGSIRTSLALQLHISNVIGRKTAFRETYEKAVGKPEGAE